MSESTESAAAGWVEAMAHYYVHGTLPDGASAAARPESRPRLESAVPRLRLRR